ncbi:MAG: tetratricopeptide repeat protein [Phycisphaerae bacterium]|nr:tetratricopeptide repeat protein [Phycisphaerae bacterium]
MLFNRSIRNLPGASVALLITVFLLSGNALAQTSDAPAQTSGLTVEQKLELAIRKIDSQDFREVERLINEVAVEKPNTEKLKLARGLYFVATKRFVEAVAELENYNMKASGDYRGYAAVGDLYIRSRMYSSALVPLERAKDLAPTKDNGKSVKSEILINLATTQLGLQNNKTAVKIAKEAQSFAPDDGQIVLRVAEIAANAGDQDVSLAAVEQAILLFKSDIRDDPFNRSAHEQLIQCYRIASSINDSQRNADPENPEPYVRATRAMLAASEIERRISMLDAHRFLQQAIERAPKNAEYRLMLADLEYDIGGIKDSEVALDEVLTGDPKNARALELKEKFSKSPPRPTLP